MAVHEAMIWTRTAVLLLCGHWDSGTFASRRFGAASCGNRRGAWC